MSRATKLLIKWWDDLKATENTNRAIALATIVIALSAVVQIGVAVAQWHEMRTGGQQTEKIINAATKIETDLNTANSQNLVALRVTVAQNQQSLAATVNEMKKQSDAIRDNTRDFEDATRKQLQPYGFLQRMDLAEPILPNKETKVLNSFENAGNTPAYNVQSLGTAETFVDGSKPKFVFSAVTGGKATIAPKGTFDSPLKIGPMTAPQVDQVNAGTRIVYMVGEINYTDIFNRSHQTHYCMVLNPRTGEMLGCPDQGKSY